MSCPDCFGARAVPDDMQGGGYRTCPGCLLAATSTSVCFDTEEDTAPTA